MIIAGVIGFVLGVVATLVLNNNKSKVKETVTNEVNKI